MRQSGEPTKGSLHLLATVGGERVLIPAALVDSVVEVEAVTPVPRAAPHVAGLAPLRSRVLTIVDSRAAIGLPALPQGEGARSAVVVAIDGHGYGLLVDEIDDVVTVGGAPRPAGAGLAAGWARATAGLVEHDGRALLLLDVAALVAGPQLAAA